MMTVTEQRVFDELLIRQVLARLKGARGANQAMSEIAMWATRIYRTLCQATPHRTKPSASRQALSKPLSVADMALILAGDADAMGARVQEALEQQIHEIAPVLEMLRERGVHTPKIDSPSSSIAEFCTESWHPRFVAAWLIVWSLRRVEDVVQTMSSVPSLARRLSYPLPPPPRDTRRLRNSIKKLDSHIKEFIPPTGRLGFLRRFRRLARSVLDSHARWIAPRPTGLQQGRGGKKIVADIRGAVGQYTEAMHQVGGLSVASSIDALCSLLENFGIQPAATARGVSRDQGAWYVPAVAAHRNRYLRQVSAGRRPKFRTWFVLIY